jgi:hypothetical protein
MTVSEVEAGKSFFCQEKPTLITIFSYFVSTASMSPFIDSTAFIHNCWVVPVLIRHLIEELGRFDGFYDG